MHVVVFVPQIVFCGARAQVSVLVEVDTVVVGDQSPDSDVKLPSIKQEWMLNVLLNDPRFCLRIPMKNKIIDFL